MHEDKYFLELNKCTQKILNSSSSKKLIVSGPGTGKTEFFRKVIEHYGGTSDDYLIVTFLNNLVDELKKKFGNIAKTFTFHGYCYYLLNKNFSLRYGLKNDFYYYPALIKLIKSDWELLKNCESPEFVKLIRNLEGNKELDFFITRANFYNAVGYDDSIFRIFKSFKNGNSVKQKYKLVIVDEYQDFNMIETAVLMELIKNNPTLIVGDDDQALYCKLRDSNPDFIRNLYNNENFQKFELPFCLRCPNAVIEAFNRIVEVAKERGLLNKRINKKFSFFPPIKGKDSEKYPYIQIVISSIQKKNPLSVNYFGKFIIQEIKKIPLIEIEESHENNFPTVLIIGPTYYLKTIIPSFDNEGLNYDIGEAKQNLQIDINDGYKYLKENQKANLGWRIIIEKFNTDFPKNKISNLLHKNENLIDILPANFINKILVNLKNFNCEEENKIGETITFKKAEPIIKLTTFEGAKGLSSQYVFILGLQNSVLPANPENIKDIELCKFLVALTRTRKKCYILSTTNFGGKFINISEFINWLPKEFIFKLKINKSYWIKNT